MTNYLNSTNPVLLDFETCSEEAITFSSEAINEAIKLSTQIPNEQRQWQRYLNALAFFGIKKWLEERASEITFNQEECSLFQPAFSNLIEGVFNLNINDFKVCLIAQGSLTDEEVTLPRAVIDLPEFIAHFYLLVEVQEEQETASVRGFLSYNQLQNRRKKVDLKADEDWTYQLPFTWFDEDPDRLLLALRCLEPSAIPLPVIPNRLKQLTQMRLQLEAILPQLKSPEFQLWQVLKWEQATVVLTSPVLLNWLYELQTQTPLEPNTNPTHYLSDLLHLLTQNAMNVGRWLSDELDELAKELSWQLLPSFAPAVALRSPSEEFEAIINELQHNSVDIPLEAARGAYRNLRLAGIPLRLYALTWPLVSESIPEWTLLLILGTPSQTSLPPGLKLRISDQTGILVEQVLETDHHYPYFFTSVVGTWDEKFIATISLGSGIEETLPPFSFEVERSA